MNGNWIWFVAAPALSAPLWWTGAEDGVAAAQSPSQGDASHADVDAWRARLEAADLDERLRAFEDVVEHARRDEALREALSKWAHDRRAGELAWTSKLALRELDGPRPFASQHGGGLRRFGDGTGNGFFRGRPFADLEQRFDELQRQFGGLDSMFGDLQREMERAFQGAPGHGLAPHSGGGSRSSAQSYSMQVGPDGVKVEVTEEVDGQRETKSYSADSLEDLYTQHPELRDRLGATPRVEIFGGPGLLRRAAPRLDDAPPAPELDKRPAKPLLGASSPRTDILGVVWSKPEPKVVDDAKVASGVGLKVDSVQPGTIAQTLGVRPGDVLLELNGTALKDGEDVRRVLRERARDADVVLVLLDGKGQRHTLTWKPDARL